MSLKVWVGGITFKWGMRSLTKLPIYSLANYCGGAAARGRGERKRKAFTGWEALPCSAPLINLLAAGAPCCAHLHILKQAFGVRDRDFSTNLLTGGYMHGDFTGFPSSLCKALFRCGTCRHDLIGAGDKGSVNSPACEYDISLLPGVVCVCGGGLFITFTRKPWKIAVCKLVSGVWSTLPCFRAAMYFQHAGILRLYLDYWCAHFLFYFVSFPLMFLGLSATSCLCLFSRHFSLCAPEMH